MHEQIYVTLKYTGGASDKHEIDLYDVAHALVGFQRTIALTTHLVLNGDIITQVPSLKGADIIALPPEKGSWELTAAVTITSTALYYLGTAPNDTPLGHLIHSAYDYVVKKTLGFNVDYNKSLGQQIEELQNNETNTTINIQDKFNELAEKCEPAIKDMHRPISGKGTADTAIISTIIDGKRHTIGHPINIDTYNYIVHDITRKELVSFGGLITGYNSKTYTGRMDVPVNLLDDSEPNRKDIVSVRFKLSGAAKNKQSATIITDALADEVKHRGGTTDNMIFCNAYKVTSKSGRLKSVKIISVSKELKEK